jgi:RNA polymerase sigma-70 factor (ECF subfamily)
MEMSDFEIVEKTRAGNKELFGLLIERYQNKLYDLAARMTGNKQEAEDIVQQAFIKMYEKLGDYKENHKFSNWAYTIALNITRNFLRRRAVLNFFSLDGWGESAQDEDSRAWEIKDPAPETENELENKELRAGLESAVDKLPLKLKDVFVLYYFHHNAISDVAQAAGISENAVSARLFRARQLLYGELSGKFTGIPGLAI